MKRKDLLKAIQTVLPGIEKKESLLEGADSLLFKKNWIHTFNNNISVSCPFKSGIEGAVRAAETYKILSKMKGEDLEVKTGESLSLSDGTTTLKMNIWEQKIFGHVENLELDKVKWNTIPEDFFEGIKSAIFSCAKSSPSLPVLEGICVKGSSIFSTDNFRATWFKMEQPMKSEFVIRSNIASELLKFSLTHYGLHNGWIHFKNKEGAVVSGRLIQGEYPSEEIEKLFPEKFPSVYSFPEEMSEALDRIGVMPSEDETTKISYIFISIKKSTITLLGNKDFGEVEEKLKMKKEISGEKIELKIPLLFLKEILKHTSRFSMDDGKLYFRSKNFNHLVSVL